MDSLLLRENVVLQRKLLFLLESFGMISGSFSIENVRCYLGAGG